MLFLQLGPEYQRLRLHYEIHGTGQIKIIFIMGLLADGAAWVHQVDRTHVRLERSIVQLAFRRISFVTKRSIK